MRLKGSVIKGSVIKIVTIEDAPAQGVDDRAIEDFALDAAGETRDSTFGLEIGWFSLSPGVAQVTIFLD